MDSSDKAGVKRRRNEAGLTKQPRGRSKSEPATSDALATATSDALATAPVDVGDNTTASATSHAISTAIPALANLATPVEIQRDNDGAGGSESADDESDSEQSDDASSPSVRPVERKVLPQRITRGMRMGRLVGEAAEADETFWGQTAFNEGSSGDEGFSSSDAEALSGTTCSSDSDIDAVEPGDDGDEAGGGGARGGKGGGKGRGGGGGGERDEPAERDGGGGAAGRYVDKGAAGVAGVDFKAAIAKAMQKVQRQGLGNGGEAAVAAGQAERGGAAAAGRPTRAGSQGSGGGSFAGPARELRASTLDSAKEIDVRAWRLQGACCRPGRARLLLPFHSSTLAETTHLLPSHCRPGDGQRTPLPQPASPSRVALPRTHRLPRRSCGPHRRRWAWGGRSAAMGLCSCVPASPPHRRSLWRRRTRPLRTSSTSTSSRARWVWGGGDCYHRWHPSTLMFTLSRQESERAAREAERAAHAGKGHAFPAGTALLRSYSRRGCPDSLTFTEVDNFPSAIRAARQGSGYPRAVKCAVTGRPARYLDPLTGRPYADAAAFAVLRQRYGGGAGAGGAARGAGAPLASPTLLPVPAAAMVVEAAVPVGV